jgi:hypothetical protein
MNTNQISSTIRNSIYEKGLIRRTLNFLNKDRDEVGYIFCPVLHRQVNVGYPDADFVNSQSLHKALLRLVKIELTEKYPRLEKVKIEL